MDMQIYQALNMTEDFWEIGDETAIVTTESGGRYIVQPDGTVTGGSNQVNGVRLNGAVYRPGGPIRTKVVVYGLRMELAEPGRLTVTVTTPVVSIENA